MRTRLSRYLVPIAALATAATLVGAAPASAKTDVSANPGAKPLIAGVCGSLYSGSWPPPTIRRGSVNTSGNSPVKLAQCYLNLSIRSSNLVIDGRFGPQTDATTRFFQSASCANVPPVDGIIGPNTWNALHFWANSPNFAC
jgi:peptidoglycan hydrolase-like protein with peptidoglycan-binding domain